MREPRSTGIRVRLLLLLSIFAGAALLFGYRDQFSLEALEALVAGVEHAGVLAPVAFTLVYALGTVLVVSGLAMTLAGGVLFGPFLGTALNLTGALIGASAAFLIARYLGAEWVEARIGGRLRQVRDGIDREGWRFVAFVRLVPLFPFVLLNYVLGLTRIPLGQYVLTSAICMLPATAAYTWLGHAGREAFSGEESMIRNVLIALALLALVIFLPRLVAGLRRGPAIDVQQLHARLDADEELLLLDVRTAEECAGQLGVLPQALNVPLQELDQRMHQIVEWAEKPIAIIGSSDTGSTKAARILASNGFADVHVVNGGMTAWRKAGLPVRP